MAKESIDTVAQEKINTNSTLALKYRPKVLEDIAGHKQVVEVLRVMFKSKEIPNAIAITGLSGCGKTTISRMIARYINCEEGTACGKCSSCREMDSLSNMDYTEVNGSEAGNIETIRKLIDSANFKPRRNLRIIMIDECHRMTTAASNALLKPLEEPPEHTLWILATTDPEKIPNNKAVLGRCQQLVLTPPTREEIAKRLKTVSRKEGFDWYSKDAGLSIAEASGGQVRDSLQILESVSKYIKGLKKVPKKKKLASLIQELAVKNVDQNLDKNVMNILIGIYTQDPKRCQKAIMDCDEHTAVMNKLLLLNLYVVNKTLIGKHEKVWDTVVNRGLWNFLKDKDSLPDVEFVLDVHNRLTILKEKLSGYLVGGEHLFTSYLTMLCTEYGETDEDD